MVGAMIHEVLKHLPEGLGLRGARHGFVVNDAVKIFRLQRGNVGKQVSFDFSPTRADGCEIWKLGAGWVAVGTMTLPTLEPDPFYEHDVRQRVAHRWKAAAEILYELGFGDFGAGFQSATVGPGIEIIEESEIFQVHEIVPRRLNLFYNPAGLMISCAVSPVRARADSRAARWWNGTTPLRKENFRCG